MKDVLLAKYEALGSKLFLLICWEGAGASRWHLVSIDKEAAVRIASIEAQHPVVSDPYDGNIPTSIPPVSEATEKRIMTAMLTELNDIYGLKLDTDPDLSRNTSHNAGNSHGRVILVGGSHMARLAEALQQGGSETRHVGSPGWVATRDSLADAAGQLANLRPTQTDIIVMDIWSNSAYMGTDEFGLPLRAQKSSVDFKYHILGNLQAAPKTLFDKIMQDQATLWPMILLVALAPGCAIPWKASKTWRRWPSGITGRGGGP